MIEHRPFAEIGGTQAGWLTAKHHFAPGRFGNPDHRPLGVNGVRVAAREGVVLRDERSLEVCAVTDAELVLVIVRRAG